jgi:acyl-CoA synthetase (AMP-forming)/AMP-acid ligase II
MTLMPAFDAARVLDEIERQGVTHLTVVPTMLAALNEEQSARSRDVSSLRGILHGGAPFATETLRSAHVAFPATELQHVYGTAETAPLVTMLPHEERLLDTRTECDGRLPEQAGTDRRRARRRLVRGERRRAARALPVAHRGLQGAQGDRAALRTAAGDPAAANPVKGAVGDDGRWDSSADPPA